MFPAPFQIGPVSISFYGIMVASGVLAALALYSLTAPWRSLKAAPMRDFCFWVVLAGLLGSRIFYVIFHWPEFSGNFWGVLAYWRGGLMFQGGLFLAALMAPLILKRYGLPLWPAIDISVPSLALGQSFGRLGCFGAGCCYGGPVSPDNPVGIIFPPGSLAPAFCPLWPTQLMESLGLLFLTFVLLGALKSTRPFFRQPGRVAGLYLTGAGLLRGGMDFLRDDFRGDAIFGNLPPTTLMAFLAAILGFWLLMRKTGPRSGQG